MRHEKSGNQVEEMLAKYLHRELAEFDFDRWAQRFPEEARLTKTGFAGTGRNTRDQLVQIWRIIMTSRYTRYAGVAAVLLVGISFLFPGPCGIVPESVAWGDVQKALIEQEQARVTGVRNCYFGDDETPTYELRVEKSLSLSYGYADRTFTEEGELLIEFTYHIPTGTVNVLFPMVKKYYRMEVPQAYREKMKDLTPEKFFEWIWASGDYRKLDPKEVKGIEAAGFEVSDLVERFVDGTGIGRKAMKFFFDVSSLNARMWVDPKNRLPVMVEAEGEVDPCLLTGYRKMRLHEVDDRWDFAVDLEESLFNPKIPEDYERIGIPAVAKAGAALYSLGLASIPVILIRARRRS